MFDDDVAHTTHHSHTWSQRSPSSSRSTATSTRSAAVLMVVITVVITVVIAVIETSTLRRIKRAFIKRAPIKHKRPLPLEPTQPLQMQRRRP